MPNGNMHSEIPTEVRLFTQRNSNVDPDTHREFKDSPRVSISGGDNRFKLLNLNNFQPNNMQKA